MRKLAFLLTFFALAGCFGTSVPLVTSDFRFSNAGGFGTQNGGFFSPGQMFVWNTESNDLELIHNAQLTPVRVNSTRGDQKSKGVSGVALTGIPVSLSGDEQALRASIGAQTVFEVSNAVREDYNGAITAISDYVTAQLESGNNPDLTLKPRDNRYRIVMITSVVRAESSNLSINGTDASDPDRLAEVALSNPLSEGDIASIRVRASSSTTCGAPEGTDSASFPVCFFNVLVRDPHYVEGNPKMQFRSISSPKDKLPDAFRNLR